MDGRAATASGALALLALAASACVAPAELDPVAGAPAVLTHEFPTLSIDPGSERNFICQSWTLDNDEPLYVNTVAVAGGPGWHHSNWLWAPEGDFAGPDGTWACDERGFELVKAGLAGGVLFTQSPEVEAEVQQLGPGVTVVIPPRAKIIAEVHLLNVSDAVLTTSAQLELHLLPADEVTVELSLLALSNYALALPPSSRSAFTAACDLTAVTGSRLDVRVHHLAPHYHALGEGMRVEAFGRDGASELIYETARHIGEPLGYTPAQPFDLGGADGIRFTCAYDNDRPEPVGFGSGERDEMCVLFAFVDGPLRWIGGVLPGAETVAVEPVEPDRPTFASDCQVVAVGR